jgi:DNA-binding response OmpR family regulator
VLREVLASALARYARDAGWDLHLDAVATTNAFMQALSRRRRDLAVVDSDALGPAADALVEGVRSHAQWARLPVILLSHTGPARAEDRCTVTMQKPVAMKALLHTTGLLLRRAEP